MGEDVVDVAGDAAPFARQRRRSEIGRADLGLAPGASGGLGHAAEETFRRAAAQEDGAVGAHRDEGDAAPGRAFGLRRTKGEEFGVAGRARLTRLAPWAERAGRLLRGADGGAEVHHGLGEVAGAGRGCQGGGADTDLGFRRRHGLGDAKEAGDDALDVTVDHRRRAIEGDGRDRRRRIGADAGEREEPLFGFGEAAAELAGDGLGAGLEIAGAGIVTEPGPGLHDVLFVGGGEIGDTRPAGGERLEIGLHGGDGRLLQHDLGEPDPIGIGRHTGRARLRVHPPGQAAVMTVVPGEEVGGGGRGHFPEVAWGRRGGKRRRPCFRRRVGASKRTCRANPPLRLPPLDAVAVPRRWRICSSTC